MIRGFRKVFGTAAVIGAAACAFGAIPASADVITAESTPLTLTGAQEGTDVIKVDGGEIKCSTVKYTGSLLFSPSSTLALTPTFSGCSFAGLAASVQMNGCTYLVHVGATFATTASGTLDIVCPAGKEMTVTAPTVGTTKCAVHIPAQTGLESVSVGNVGSGTTREVTVSFSIGAGLTRIKYSQTAGTAETGNCPTADGTTSGTQEARLLLTAENGSAHKGIFASS